MYCNDCGTYLKQEDKFCTNCGTPVHNSVDKGGGEKPKFNANLKAGKFPHVSNYRIYFNMLYGGLFVLITSLVLLALVGKSNILYAIFGLSAWAILMAQIFIYVFVYQFWRFVLHVAKEHNLHFEVTSAGKAVGFLFIPIYNIFYWNFRVFRDLPQAFNDVAEANGLEVRMQLSPAEGIPVWILIGMIPYVNIIVMIALFFYIYPKFVIEGVDSINQFKTRYNEYETH